MKKLALTILIFQLISLSNLNGQEIIESRILKQVQEYLAEHFVAKVSDMLIKEGNVYFIDQGLTAIIKTDLELQFISKFGEQGMGPNEMERPEFLLNIEDSPNLLVLDTRLRKLLEYSQDGKLLGSPSTLQASLISHPFMFNSVLYYRSGSDPTIDIAAYDLNNKKALPGINLKGDFRESGLGRDIHPYKNQFVSVVNYSPPVIEVFNKDWNLTHTLDLTENPLIAKRVAFKKPSGISITGTGKNKIKQIASGEVIIKCSRLYKDKLYLLASTMNGREDTIANTVFTYELQNNTWVQKEQINLPKQGNYNTFAMLDDKRLVAFEWVSSTLQLLELKK